MPEHKPKLPRSVLVLNIIMIILVLVICGLVISLLYSDVFRPQEETTLDISVSTPVEGASGSSSSTTTSATTTTTPKSSVSMTKRTTEPTEPVTTSSEVYTEDTSSTPTEDPDIVNNTDYDPNFFTDDLFIGDSITTGIYLYNKLPMMNVAASVGYTPYKAYTEAIDLYDGSTATALQYAERMQPERIYIMLGSNGLISASAMEDSYHTLISKLTAACPDSVLYCISVPPVTSDSSLAASGGITNNMVVQFNTFIKSVCSEEGIKYIDLYSQVIDSNGYFLHEYAERDGLHFKGSTYDLMLWYIQSVIEE